jgi:hypothetical protein
MVTQTNVNIYNSKIFNNNSFVHGTFNSSANRVESG